jgi:hypothetical protein
MGKSIVAKLLRESLKEKLQELEQNDDANKDSKDGAKPSKIVNQTKKIMRATQGKGKLLKLSQVMAAAGIGDADSATDRSEIGKQVAGKEGRHLSPKNAAKLSKVVDNPTAYL